MVAPGLMSMPVTLWACSVMIRGSRGTTVSVKSQELQYKPRNCEGNCQNCTKPEPFWEGQGKSEE